MRSGTMLKNVMVIVAVLGLTAGGAFAAPAAPSGGTWLYLTKLQTDCATTDGYHDPKLYAVWFDANWDIDCTTWTEFTPAIQSDWGGMTSGGAGSYRPGGYCGATVVMTAPTPTSHAELLVGAYYDNDPGNPTSRYTMDVLKLQMSGTTLTQTSVYDGAAYAASTWHTQDMSAVYYSESSALTGETDSLLVSKAYAAGSTTFQFNGVGYIADSDADGSWDDETGVYQNRGYVHSVGVTAGPALFSPFVSTTYRNEAGYSSGINQSRRLSDGTILNNVYYGSSATGIQVGAPRMNATANANMNPQGRWIWADDIGHDNSPDVFWCSSALLQPDCTTLQNVIMWSRDMTNDYDAMDAGETTIFYRFPKGPADVYDYSAHVFGVIEGDNGWTVLAGAFPHVNNGPYYIVAIEVLDNGDAGDVKTIMSDVKAGQYSWYPYNFHTFVGVQSEEAPIPEPGTMLLLGTGLIGALGWMRRRRMK